MLRISLLAPCLLFAVSILCGCSSDRRQGTGEALATTTAVLITVPFAPLAEGYHLLSGDIRNRNKAIEAENAKLDPIYEERGRILSARDAVNDADIVARDGFIVFLPAYRGMVEEGRANRPVHSKPEFYAAYEKALDGSKLYKSLCDLVFDDPSQEAFEKENGFLPFTPTYNQYRKVVWKYVRAFNDRMSRIAREAR